MWVLLKWTRFGMRPEKKMTKKFYPHTDHYSIPSSFSFACHAEAERRRVFRNFLAFSLRLLLFLLSPILPAGVWKIPHSSLEFFEGRPTHICAVQDTIQQKIKEWAWLAALAQLNQNL